jgi:hypothetical protein
LPANAIELVERAKNEHMLVINVLFVMMFFPLFILARLELALSLDYSFDFREFYYPTYAKKT